MAKIPKRPAFNPNDFFSWYLKHKLVDSQKPSTKADVVLGIPLFAALAVALSVKFWNALESGRISVGKRDVIVMLGESPGWFTFHVATNFLVILLLLTAIFCIITNRLRGR